MLTLHRLRGMFVLCCAAGVRRAVLLLDQRSAQARMLRDRLASVQKAEQQTAKNLPCCAMK